MTKILFVCTYSGGRARIAEEFVRQMASPGIVAKSACFDPDKIVPLVIETCSRFGIALGSQSPVSVFELHKSGETYDFVVTLCHENSTEQCPIFLQTIDTLYTDEAVRVSWSIPGFHCLSTTGQVKKEEAFSIALSIKAHVVSLIEEIQSLSGVLPEKISTCH